MVLIGTKINQSIRVGHKKTIIATFNASMYKVIVYKNASIILFYYKQLSLLPISQVPDLSPSSE